MKRQNVRKALVILSFLLLPITMWYLSPYLIIQGAMDGIVSGSFIVFITLLIIAIFFGRFFCGWICPMGGLQECLFLVNEKVPKQGWKNNIKYMIWIVWFIAIILLFILRNNTISIDFFYMTDHGISISNIYGYVIYYGVIFFILIPAVIFGKRLFCHYFCWIAPFMVIGCKIGKLLNLPRLHIESEKKDCISCKKCNKSCPMGLDVENMVKNEKDFGSECINCGSCVDNCTKNILSYGFKRKNKNGKYKKNGLCSFGIVES